MRKWIRALLVIAALMGTFALFHVPILRGAARWLDVGQEPVATDYVVVMPGDSNTRPFVAAALIKAGLARRVLVPETVKRPEAIEGLIPTEEEVMRRILESRGVPPSDIVFVEGRSISTFDDAQGIANYLADKPEASITIATTNHHTRRALWTFQRVFRGTKHELHVVSAPTDGFSADNWWQVRDGIYAYVNEFLKLGLYWVLYGGVRIWAAIVGAAVILMWVYRGRRRRLQSSASSVAA